MRPNNKVSRNMNRSSITPIPTNSTIYTISANSTIPTNSTIPANSTSSPIKSSQLRTSQNDKKMMSSSVGCPVTNNADALCEFNSNSVPLNDNLNDKKMLSSSMGAPISTSTITNSGNLSKENTLDLSISRFGMISNEVLNYNVELPRIQEGILVQNLMKEFQYVLKFDDEILEEQCYYWLSFISIISQLQRDRIKSTLENHFKTPIVWLSNNEIEINVNPNYRIVKQREIK